MTILRKLYINPIIDLSYVFRRFHEILRDEYNSFCEYCVFVKNKYIIYSSEDLNISSIKLSFLSDYPPTKFNMDLKCNNTYYLNNPNDSDISGVVNLFVNDCKHYICQTEELGYVDDIRNNIMELYCKKPSLTKVISSGPATIAFWDDGTKTVVKCQEDDTYDAEKGILYAILRKCMSNNKDYHNFLTEIDRFKTFVEETKRGRHNQQSRSLLTAEETEQILNKIKECPEVLDYLIKLKKDILEDMKKEEQNDRSNNDNG